MAANANTVTSGEKNEITFSKKKQAFFTLIIFVTFLIILEIALRLLGIPRELRQDDGLAYDTKNSIGYEYTPGWSGYYAGAKVRINSAGWRGKDFAATKPEGIKRIICIGDSFTFGKAVSDEEVYVEQLGGLLNADGPAPYEIINAGHDGVNTFQELQYLKERSLMELKPDVVILGFTVSNDAELNFYDNRLILRNQLRDSGLLLDISESKSYRTLARSLRIAKIFKSGVEWAYKDRVTELSYKLKLKMYDDNEAWESCRNSLLGIYDLCRERNVPLLVALFPIWTRELDQTFKDYPQDFKKIHDKLNSVFKDKGGVTVVEVLDELAGTGKTIRELEVPVDGHPNRIWHEVVARKLHATLKGMGF